jgi:hypothetical protein
MIKKILYILRGMGLGGWMLQEGYMMSPSGFSDTSILEILHTISFPATNGWQD